MTRAVNIKLSPLLDAKCPMPDCNLARAQYLDPNFESGINAVPRYLRFEYCSERRSKV